MTMTAKKKSIADTLGITDLRRKLRESEAREKLVRHALDSSRQQAREKLLELGTVKKERDVARGLIDTHESLLAGIEAEHGAEVKRLKASIETAHRHCHELQQRLQSADCLVVEAHAQTEQEHKRALDAETDRRAAREQYRTELQLHGKTISARYSEVCKLEQTIGKWRIATVLATTAAIIFAIALAC